ncbi:MAG: disulfide oxidoreductase [Acidimicrobiia bacterium]|nr:disulfide oxidoreductase [Acidimicrobiia bacterium]
MNLDQLNLLFALLALLALGGGIVTIAVGVAGRAGWVMSEAVRGAGSHLSVPIAWAVAATSMAGSLYYSEVAGFVPCTLCWYQRIAMYPLALILLIAAIRKDNRTARWAGVPLAATGWGISLYHYLLQVNPSWSGTACSASVPCNFRWVSEFGFVSIPFMALSGFTAIVALLVVFAREA